MDKVVNFLNTVPGWLKPIGYAISIIMFIGAGILMMTGQEGSARAKKMLGYLLIGLAVIFLAANIASTIRNAAS